MNFGSTITDKTLPDISLDASARLRVGQLTTLGDLKTLNEDDPLLIENVGTGTGLWGANKYNMSVTSAQYLIRRSKQYYTYFSGKSQQVEITFDAFGTQANTVKRVGYFSSVNTAPYDTAYDGFWLENDGTTVRLKASRSGTSTLDIPIANWNGDAYARSYNWNNFTVIMFDFLWLGGAVLRLFLKTDRGFILCHTFNYAGSTSDVFITSPNQNIRYEIRSTTGTGSLRAICAQCATEGSVNEAGKQRSVNTTATTITLATIGTTYLMKGIRKKTTHRDRGVKLIGCSSFVNSNDQLLVTIQLNPTLSSAPTWSDIANSAAQECVGDGAITISSAGTVLYSMYVGQNTVIPPNVVDKDFLSDLGLTISNVSDELVLCGTPITANVSSFGTLNFKEY